MKARGYAVKVPVTGYATVYVDATDPEDAIEKVYARGVDPSDIDAGCFEFHDKIPEGGVKLHDANVECCE